MIRVFYVTATYDGAPLLPPGHPEAQPHRMELAKFFAPEPAQEFLRTLSSTDWRFARIDAREESEDRQDPVHKAAENVARFSR